MRLPAVDVDRLREVARRLASEGPSEVAPALEDVVKLVLLRGLDGVELRVAEDLGSVLAESSSPTDSDSTDLSIKRATRMIEARFIREALRRTNGNRTKAARLLDLSHRALLYKMKEYGIESPLP